MTTNERIPTKPGSEMVTDVRVDIGPTVRDHAYDFDTKEIPSHYGESIREVFGDPVNSIDLSFDDDRVWGIQMTLNNKSIIYGYIIAMVDDDEIDKANNDEDYEMQETIYTASDFPNFSQLIQTYVEDNKNN